MTIRVSVPDDLERLREAALGNGDEQIAVLCLASKAMYRKWQAAEDRNGELSTVMVQLSSLLRVSNRRKVNKTDLLTLLDEARNMVTETLMTPEEV